MKKASPITSPMEKDPKVGLWRITKDIEELQTEIGNTKDKSAKKILMSELATLTKHRNNWEILVSKGGN